MSKTLAITSLLVFLSNHLSYAVDLTIKEKLDKAYQEREQAGLLTGAAIGLIDGDQVTTYLYGDAKSAQDHFEIGSISKSFTGILLARLVINGSVDLNSPLKTFVPELKGTWTGENVTAQLLATHKSQLPHDAPWKVDADHESGLIDYLKAYTPSSDYPAGSYSYSNVGFHTLALIMKRTSGESFQSLVRSALFSTFGMQNSGFLFDSNAFPLILTPHNIFMEPAPYDVMPDTAAASGGIFSNLSDMIKFLRANLHPELFPQQKDAILLSQKLGLGWDNDTGKLPLWKKWRNDWIR